VESKNPRMHTGIDDIKERPNIKEHKQLKGRQWEEQWRSILGKF